MAFDTVRELIQEGARIATLISDHQPVDGDYAVIGLNIFNSLLNRWSSLGSYIPYHTEYQFMTTAGKYIYTIGPSDAFDLNTNQIIFISTFNIVDESINYEVQEMMEKEYANVGYRSSEGLPIKYLLRLFSDHSKLYLYPSPYKEMTVNLWCKQHLSNVILSDQISSKGIPAHYQEYIYYAIAERFAARYKRPNYAVLQQEVSQLKAELFGANRIDLTVETDNALNRSLYDYHHNYDYY